MQALGFLVVDHPVGFKRGTAKIELHIPDGGDAFVGVVIVDFLRADEHLLLRTLGANGWFWPRWESHHLGSRRRDIERARKQRDGGRKNDERAPARAAAR